MPTYTIGHLGALNCSDKLSFTPDFPWQYVSSVLRNQVLEVPFVTDSMRKAKQLGFISISPDPDLAFIEVKDDSRSVRTQVIDFRTGASVTSGQQDAAQIDIIGGDVEPDYTIRMDDLGGGITLIGKALPGSLETDSVWQIAKILEPGDDLNKLWASGNASFVHTWANRLALTYS